MNLYSDGMLELSSGVDHESDVPTSHLHGATILTHQIAPIVHGCT